MPEDHKPASALLVARSAVILTVGFGLLRALAAVASSYVLTLLQVYSLLLLLGIEALFEPILRRVKWFLVALSVAGIAWFTIAIPLSDAPVETQAYLHPGEYAANTQIAGIPWDRHFTDLRFTLRNNTNDEYRNLDLAIVPEGWTHQAAILNQTPGCDLSLRPIDYGKVVKAAKSKTKDGKVVVTMRNNGDFYDDAGNVYVDLATTVGYRLRCASLAPNYGIQIVFASVAVPPKIDLAPSHLRGVRSGGVSSVPSTSDDLFDVLLPKPSPVEVRVKGTYVRGIKTFHIEKRVYVGEEPANSLIPPPD